MFTQLNAIANNAEMKFMGNACKLSAVILQLVVRGQQNHILAPDYRRQTKSLYSPPS